MTDVLLPRDLPRLRWNPFLPRVPNFAVFTERRGGQQPDHVDDGNRRTYHDMEPASRRDFCLRYLMACGHLSLPNHAVCERGCLEAPAWGAPFRGRDGQRGLS